MSLDYHDGIDKRLAYFKDAFERYRKYAAEMYGNHYGGDIDQAFTNLTRILEGALKVAPFKAGDRVTLIKAPKLDEGDGWWHHRHFLVVGARAEVHAVHLDTYGWRCYLWLDDESYIPSWGETKGIPQPVPRKDQHLWGFNASSLKLLEPAPEAAPASVTLASLGVKKVAAP